MTFRYSKKVLENFMHPKNLGKIENADGVGKVGNKICGDVMWVYIKVGKKGKKEYIKDIKFQTLGCAAAIATSSMITQLAKEKSLVDAEGHQFYEVVGTGDAIIFMNGEVVEGTWKKKTQLDREVFYDTNGDEVEFNHGPIWIEILPAGNEVSY